MSIKIDQGAGVTIVHILTDSVDALSAKEIEAAAGELRGDDGPGFWPRVVHQLSGHFGIAEAGD